MIKLIAIALCLSIFHPVYCQSPKTTNTAVKRFGLNKYASFSIKPGDVLVYQVDNNGDLYDFIVTVKKFGQIINFDFSMPQKNTKANVNIQNWAVENAVSYKNNFSNSNMDLAKESSVWLSQANYTDLASTAKQTTMNMGLGPEKFLRGNTRVVKIKFKGKEKTITIFEVANEAEENQKSIWLLTDPKNPLIVSMDLGWKITLVEVR